MRSVHIRFAREEGATGKFERIQREQRARRIADFLYREIAKLTTIESTLEENHERLVQVNDASICWR